MKKSIIYEFQDLNESQDGYKGTTEKLKEIYKGMGQNDDLLEHSPSRAVEYPWALSHIKGDRILDAGCGSSPMLLILKNNGFTDLTGIDTQSSFENPTFSFKPEWSEKFGINYIRANILNYRSKVYDTVFCISVLEHIIRPVDRLRALSNLWENVKDGGRLVVTCDYGEALLLGFALTITETGELIGMMTYKDKVHGICLEKNKFSEGAAEWLQINEGL